MGLIGAILGSPAATGAIGTAVTSVTEVFKPNATKQMEADAAAWQAALAEHGAEFQTAQPGLFDRVVNGLNRLPRPLLALGTLGLFVYAMIDPLGFEDRMVGLNAVPEPLWWLLGAIISFYFGAREFHYSRARIVPAAAAPAAPEDNPALNEFLSKGAAGAAPAV